MKSRVGAINFLATHNGALVCALFLIVGLGVLDDYGVLRDEEGERRVARSKLHFIMSGDEATLPQGPVRYYGIAFELPALLVERMLGLEDSRSHYLTRHLLIHLFFLLGGVFCYRLVFRLFQNRVLAVFALLLFVLHPRLYAHSFFNSKDIPFASMFMIALFLIDRAFRKDTVAAFLMLGIGVGVLTNLRIMGMMLVPAVLVMRAGDWCVASTSRSHILRTTAVFVGASLVTLYALSPYLWGNPLRFGDAFTTLAQHPAVFRQRFQGARVSSTAAPPHYIPTWFIITTPPVVLLLGLLGAGSVGFRALTRPGALLRPTSLRFGGLLVACFLLPVSAVILLRAHIYDGWRHLYFLHAPFCVLAIYGLRGVTAGCQWGPLRAGVYGLTGLGVGLVILEMIWLHPYQQVYFNRLVDRTTPEYLRSQYRLGYYGVVYREGLEYLLDRYPAGPLTVFTNDPVSLRMNLLILPQADRERIAVSPVAYDFYVTGHPLRPGIYTRKIYNNSILTVEKMTLTIEDAGSDAYQEAYEVTVADAPIIQTAFDTSVENNVVISVYLKGDTLVYVREPCDALKTYVFVHLHPTGVDDLPPQRVQYGFDNKDFFWTGPGGNEMCMRTVRLPEYDLAWLATGQPDGRVPGWRKTFIFPERGHDGATLKAANNAMPGISKRDSNDSDGPAR